jgi:hypothetical protein
MTFIVDVAVWERRRASRGVVQGNSSGGRAAGEGSCTRQENGRIRRFIIEIECVPRHAPVDDDTIYTRLTVPLLMELIRRSS